MKVSIAVVILVKLGKQNLHYMQHRMEQMHGKEERIFQYRRQMAMWSMQHFPMEHGVLISVKCFALQMAVIHGQISPVQCLNT